VEKTYVEVKDIPAETRLMKSYKVEKPGAWPPKTEVISLKRGGEKARMVPTPLGKTMLEFALKHFPDLFAYEFTAGMESRLDKVAEGQEKWKKVLEDTWNSYKDRFTTLKAGGSAGGGSKAAGNSKRREFPGGLVAVMTAKGPLLLREGATKEETVFFGWPGKKSFTELTEDEAKAHVASANAGKVGEVLGEYHGHDVLKKKGPYGFYAEWNGVKVNLAEGDDLDAIVAKIQAKSANPTKVIGPFQIKVGPYGPYIMKTGPTAGKGKPQYVSVPAGTNIETLTAQEVGEIYETGLKAKAAKGGGGFRGGRGGFRGGRGGGRGGRGGKQ
jgi:DNA topoisomerase-1